MKIFFVFTIVIFCLFLPSTAWTRTEKIFVIHSYQKGQGCGTISETGMVSYLNNKFGDNITYDHHYIDSMGKNASDAFFEQEKETVIKRLNKYDPDVVVLFDDLACRIFIPVLLNTEFNVVFGGMNLPPEKYNEEFKFMISRNKPGFNVTGVTEEADFNKALKVLKEIVPDKKNMVIISSAGMDFIPEVLENFKNTMKDQDQNFPFKLIDTVYVKNFSELKNSVVRYGEDESIDVIFVFCLMALEDESGKIVSVKDGIKWLVRNQHKPGLTWINHWVELGHLCGVCVDLPGCGVQMGRIVEKILNGTHIGEISIEKPENHFIALNLERAEFLNIKIPVHVLEAAEIVYEKAVSLY
ncbi:MAG: hypothetical protein H6680_02415 [Desulfobacteraceae bacterium]|nr:hypothetical protein [Desulfobacteraceae bacterium]